MLAPLALAVVAIAFFAVILTSGSGGDDGGGAEQTGRREAGQRDRTTTERRPRRAVYTVKVGDTLGSIAETTGVPVERLLELNPELDPQALVSGQKIKLRE
jgi:LysM repeat protein